MTKTERELLLAVAENVAYQLRHLGRRAKDQGHEALGWDIGVRALEIEEKAAKVVEEEGAAQKRFEKQTEGRGR